MHLLDELSAPKEAERLPAAEPPWLHFGRADTAVDNDFTVGPPPSPPDCHERLRAEQVRFKPVDLPVRTSRSGNICGAEQAVIYLGSNHGVRYSPAPIVACGMALALARFDAAVQSQALETFGSRVRSVRHLGTYSCRKMARFSGWMSEHSYANAIDIQSFVLESWRTVKVTSYQKHEAAPEARFLRGLARALFDEGVFSVVLTPAYDRLHHDHFHLDLARYRVDGT
ncbi:MAG TPA: extensin family protein [Polyangiaceae bacterium]|nr:extensin family protein [Polyangiaceae bacterium]